MKLNEIIPVKPVAQRSVKIAAEKQKSMKLFNSTLKDYEYGQKISGESQESIRHNNPLPIPLLF